MRTKLRGIVLVSLLAAGCHSLPLLSDGSRIPKLEAGKVSASNSDQSSQHVDSQRVDKTSIKAAAPTRHDSTEDNASLTAPPPTGRAADSVRTPVAVAVSVDELLRLARISRPRQLDFSFLPRGCADPPVRLLASPVTCAP